MMSRSFLTVQNKDNLFGFQSYTYAACKKCKQTSSCEYDEEYRCNKCGLEQVCAPSCKFNVEIKDGSGCIYAAVYGKLAEKILGLTARDIVEHDKKGEEIDVDRIQKVLDKQLFSVQLKMYPAKTEDDRSRYTIIYVANLTSSGDSSDVCTSSVNVPCLSQKRKDLSSTADVSGGSDIAESDICEEESTNARSLLKSSRGKGSRKSSRTG